MDLRKSIALLFLTEFQATCHFNHTVEPSGRGHVIRVPPGRLGCIRFPARPGRSLDKMMNERGRGFGFEISSWTVPGVSLEIHSLWGNAAEICVR